MRKLIAVLLHPFMYYRLKKAQEQMVFLYYACLLLKISEPSIWEVDRIRSTVDELLGLLHDMPHALDSHMKVKTHLFWTILLSRFKKLSVSRDEIKELLEKYNGLKQYVGKENPGVVDVMNLNIELVNRFGVLA